MLDEIKDRLAQELDRLGHELSVTLPKTIQRAVELGDLSENAEYKFALERQQFVQARIGHLSQRLSELSKIDLNDISPDRVGFGSKVTVRDLDSQQTVTYTIVSGDFIDLEAGHISMSSPIGRVLMGRALGDEVRAELPRGERRLRIEELVTMGQLVSDDGA
jgi:transcription elongation factor GreA